jgi:ribonuclease P protein component
MRGEQYLTKPEQFTNVFNQGASLAERPVALRYFRNGLPVTRFGFSVSSRVGGAVVRNRVKRRLREILRKIPMEPGWDIVIIARMPAVRTDFDTLGESVRRLLVKASILKTGP